MVETAVAGLVVSVKKPEPFLRKLFQAAVEIIKRKPPEATIGISTVAAVSTGLCFLFSSCSVWEVWKRKRSFCGRKIETRRLRYEFLAPTGETIRTGLSSGDDALWSDIAYSDVVRV